jgi:hypothetical protein
VFSVSFSLSALRAGHTDVAWPTRAVSDLSISR